MNFVSRYQGSSFTQLLEIDYPQLRPGWEGLGKALELSPVPHGTTVLGQQRTWRTTTGYRSCEAKSCCENSRLKAPCER